MKRDGALAGDVDGPAAVDLAGVGAEAPPRAPAAGAHPALAHGPPHAPLGRERPVVTARGGKSSSHASARPSARRFPVVSGKLV